MPLYPRYLSQTRSDVRFHHSGKSTQLPSFILESCLARGQDCKIYVTEPRRISAISLAQRVSKELGDAGAGKTDGLVGYSIRLENNIGPNTVCDWSSDALGGNVLTEIDRCRNWLSLPMVSH
jgi:hypothetical protein